MRPRPAGEQRPATPLCTLHLESTNFRHQDDFPGNTPPTSRDARTASPAGPGPTSKNNPIEAPALAHSLQAHLEPRSTTLEGTLHQNTAPNTTPGTRGTPHSTTTPRRASKSNATTHCGLAADAPKNRFRNSVPAHCTGAEHRNTVPIEALPHPASAGIPFGR